jgi:hypothetical protein
VDVVALEQVFLPVLLFSPVSIILPLLCAYLTRSTKRRSLGTSQEAMRVRELGSIGWRVIDTVYKVIM